MALGYYSVVQYVEDIGRREPMNVGVVVTCDGRLELSFTERPDVDDHGAVQRFAETLQYIFEHELPIAPGRERMALDELAHRRFSRFTVTEPRPVEITQLSTTLEELRERCTTPNSSQLQF